MTDKLKLLTEKKLELESLQPLPQELLDNLEGWFRVELTYSSNAIEGNTLSRIETAEVIERGISAVISGKPLKDQLEAINHAKALEFIKNLAKERKSHQFITEGDIKAIHQIILTGIDDNWAGKYRRTEVFIRGSDAEFPLPNAIPFKMQEFIQWLQGQQEEHPVRIAANAHFRMSCIHPFIDGNGRTARLLMNLILIMHKFPMAVIRNEDRTKYLETFGEERKNKNIKPFYDLIECAVENSIDVYIKAGKGEIKTLSPITKTSPNKKLLKIGKLAKETDETVPTIRFWTKEGLIRFAKTTESGYALYDQSEVGKVKQIRKLQSEKRFTIAEIKRELKPQ